MRNMWLLALPFVVLAAGCQMVESKTHCGYGVWFYKPPTIDTNMPVLVNQGQTMGTAHPLGTVAGPVSDGTFSHAPIPPMGMAPMPKGTSSIGSCDPQCPYPGPPRMTIQEWCEAAEKINAKAIPATPSRNTQ